MKKLIWIVAALLLVVGLAVMGIAAWQITRQRFDIMNEQYTEERVDLAESFTDVEIDAVSFDVVIEPKAGESAIVIADNGEKLYCEAKVEQGKLTVTERDTRAWYEKITVFDVYRDQTVRVLLPERIYNELKVHSVSGDVTLRGDTVLSPGSEAGESTDSGALKMGTFENAEITTTSGDVSVLALTRNLRIRTTSGDVSARNEAQGALFINTVSGEVELSDSAPRTLQIETTSGDVELERVYAEQNMEIDTTSGEVEIYDGDAGSKVRIETTSGDVTALFASAKDFEIGTASGELERRPNSTAGATRCYIQTTSGDIEVSAK